MIYEAKIGTRLNRYFYGVQVNNRSLWWNEILRLWEEPDPNYDGVYVSCAPCRTVRAFRRMLRNNPNIKGHSRLVSNYVGYDVYA